MEVDLSNWLIPGRPLVITGYIRPGWLLVKPLLGVQEQDEAGYYFISNEELGLYAVGFTEEEALEDFKKTLISNYRRLAAQVGDNSDLKALFQEYEGYLQLRSADTLFDAPLRK